MSNHIAGIFFGVGFAGWVYVKMQRRSADPKSVWIITALAGLTGYFVVSSALGLVSN